MPASTAISCHRLSGCLYQGGHGVPDIHIATIERVEAALEDVAYLFTKDPRYLPVFERLLKEHQAMQKQQDLRSRAHAIIKARTVSRTQAV